MSNLKKFIITLIIIVIFIVGLIIGLVWKDLPFVKFNNEIKLYEVANLLLTIIIGVSIPLLLKKWIEDNRSVKGSLVDEVKNIISSIDRIKCIITKCHSDLSVSKEQKDEVNYIFHTSELQINSLIEQIKISFDPQSKAIIENLKKNYHTYKDFLTGGEFMISSFTKIDDRFYREHNTEQAKIETCLKTIIHKIYKL